VTLSSLRLRAASEQLTGDLPFPALLNHSASEQTDFRSIAPNPLDNKQHLPSPIIRQDPEELVQENIYALSIVQATKRLTQQCPPFCPMQEPEMWSRITTVEPRLETNKGFYGGRGQGNPREPGQMGGFSVVQLPQNGGRRDGCQRAGMSIFICLFVLELLGGFQ
jgi:hypothetical protein